MTQVTSATYTNTTAATTSSSSTNSLSASSFLTLLTQQLQAQDPLNPMDNAQMTSQLAQISTVQGIGDLNTTLKSVLTQLGSVDQLNATSMIGHTVLVDGTRIELSRDSSGNAVADGAIDLSGAASDVKVKVYNSGGALVKTIDLGSLSAGSNSFSWDGTTDAGGTAADGNYTFSVTALQGNQSVSATTLSYARVDGVRRDTSGNLQLDLGGLGLYTQDQIVQIN